MQTYLGIFDLLFGKKVTLELPSGDGSVRRVRVTQRSLEKLRREGKIKAAEKRYVTVHLLDPVAPLRSTLEVSGPSNEHQILFWVVGENVPVETYEQFFDQETQALYALTTYEDGKPRTCILRKDVWEAARKAMDTGAQRRL